MVGVETLLCEERYTSRSIAEKLGQITGTDTALSSLDNHGR